MLFAMLEYLHHPGTRRGVHCPWPGARMVTMTDELVRERIRSVGPWVALDVERLSWAGDGRSGAGISVGSTPKIGAVSRNPLLH